MPRIRRLRFFTLCIVGYMLLALAWWSILLVTKNRDAFQAKAELMQLGLAAEQGNISTEDFLLTPSYLSLESNYKNQEYMIFSEAVVFVLTIVAGIYLVNRSYRKEVEAARQQRNFLLSITHELKSPLAGIRLALETFQRRVLEAPMRERLTANALSETTRLTNLVEDLLLSAKLDTQYVPNLEPLDLQQLAKEWLERMRVKYPDIKFGLKLEGEVFDVLADRYGMSSVMSNLLENAVKYIGEGSHVDLVICERGSDVSIEVRDDGVGIPAAEKKRVLEKFYRVGNEDTRSTKGTGLGLYIVNEVVRAHQGEVTLRDNQPRGTIFEICLPFGGTA